MLVLLYGITRELSEYFRLRVGVDCCSSVYFCQDGNSHALPIFSLSSACVCFIIISRCIDGHVNGRFARLVMPV
jgi:hypothetical protein